MFKIFLIYILILICFLHYKESKADFSFNTDKLTITVIDDSIDNVESIPNTKQFTFKDNKDTYVGFYVCDKNILMMLAPGIDKKETVLTSPNSFGRMLGDYVCAYR